MNNEQTHSEKEAAVEKKEQQKTRVLNSGESFGNYIVVKCMCAGLIAHYYQMQHIRDLHEVTVGVFHHRTANEESFIKRLKDLQKTVSELTHESLPGMNDVKVVDERICIFLDPIQGSTLSQYFEARAEPGRKGIGVRAATDWITQLYAGLGYAHSHGCDHRDLDSDLIFVQEDGSIRILGLGVKAALGVELFESIVSASVSPLVSNKTLSRLNSFDIISPEYRSGIVEDARADIYEVAFVGYWLLTGRKPDLANYEAPSRIIEGISPNWDRFFEKSLERDKYERYQSCKLALMGLKLTDEKPEPRRVGFLSRQMDRIPMPRQIVESGARTARVCRLLILGLVGLTLTAIGIYFLKSGFMEQADYSRGSDVARIFLSQEKAALQLNIKPPGTKVEFVGYKESFIASEGPIFLAVPPGEYQLRLSAPDHIEQVASLRIPAETEVPESLSVELEPAWTDILIRTEPGAAVSVIDAQGTGTELGGADTAGTFSLEKGILAGTYQVRVEKEGYQPKTLENQIVEFGSANPIDAPLAPLPVNVSIQTQPAGAWIRINDVEVGKSPLTLSDVIPNNQYVVAVHLEGYRPATRRVEAKPGTDMSIDFGDLVPLSGSIQIKPQISGEDRSAPSALHDALTVIIDGVPLAYGDGVLDSVPLGEHRLRLEHPLYYSREVTLSVEDRGNYVLDFILQPRPGQVRLEMPDNLKAEVRLNGVVMPLDGKVIEVPANQAVELELRIRNYLTMVQTFELSPNESQVWEVKPVPIPGPTEGQSWTLPYFGVSFAWIPPGTFEMGSPLLEHGRLSNEGPLTQVGFTRGFWVGTYELTQAQYERVMEQNPSRFQDSGHPVESVLWSEAIHFCAMLTRFEREAGRLPEGYVYRLPTESEWEYAARAGTRTPFFFGDQADASMGYFRGVYPRDRTDGLRSPEGGYGTTAVGRYQPNDFGLHDVHGNVREWTLDTYNGRLPGDALVDPEPRSEGSGIAVRGGGWEDSAARVRSAAREQVSPDLRSNVTGFRVFLAPEL